MDRTYLCIDLKSFYASVECVTRRLDPLTTNLVVADKSRTEKTISPLPRAKSTGWCYIPRTSSLSTTSWADAPSKTDLKPHTSFKTVILSKAWAAEFVKCQALFTTARCLQTLQ